MPKRGQTPTLEQIMSGGGAEPGDELDARQRPGVYNGEERRGQAKASSNDELRSHHGRREHDHNPNSGNGGSGKP